MGKTYSSEAVRYGYDAPTLAKYCYCNRDMAIKASNYQKKLAKLVAQVPIDLTREKTNELSIIQGNLLRLTAKLDAWTSRVPQAN